MPLLGTFGAGSSKGFGQTSDSGSLFIVATGGTETTDGDYKIHTFTSSGCFVVSSAGFPTSCGGDGSYVDYLVVASGGNGPGNSGGGGGGTTDPELREAIGSGEATAAAAFFGAAFPGVGLGRRPPRAPDVISACFTVFGLLHTLHVVRHAKFQTLQSAVAHCHDSSTVAVELAAPAGYLFL